MASSCPSQDQQNFECVTIASVDFIKLPLKDILESHIQPVDLFKEIHSCPALSSHKHKLRQDQLKLCFLQPPAEPDYRKFDVTLLYTLIRNLCPSVKPTKGWGTQPDDADIQIGDDIERLRLFRNNYYGHASSATISDVDFTKMWKDLKSVINRIQSTTKCSVDYEDELIKIERAKFTRNQLENCKVLLDALVILQQQKEDGEEPRIVIKGEDEIMCGCTANFKADVKKIDLSLWSIKWHKLSGTSTESIDISKERYRGSTNTTLVIQSVCKEDEGKYQAVISQESKGIEKRMRSNIICLHVVGENLSDNQGSQQQLQESQHNVEENDNNWKAITKTEITTEKEMETLMLETMIKFLLTTIKKPSEFWLVTDLIDILEDTLKTIDDCGRPDLLRELITAIKEDDDIQFTLSRCGKRMFEVLKSMTMKYKSTELKITDGCVCFTFSFSTYEILKEYLNLLQTGDDCLRRDISEVIMNKTLLDIFHIDSNHVTWHISKVTIMRGSTFVREELFSNTVTRNTEEGIKVDEDDKMSRDCTWFCSIDIGTSFSGYAFAPRKNITQNPCEIYSPVWIKDSNSRKTPTSVLLDPERNFSAFGYAADEKYEKLLEKEEEHWNWFYFRDFKMQLYDAEVTRETSIQDIHGKPFTAQQIFTISIRFLREHFLNLLKMRNYKIPESDICYTVTVPAIWSDAAKQFMKEAAIQAGICEARLVIAYEPEAAALFCKQLPTDRMAANDEPIQFVADQPYIVVDLGGGTADITVQKISSTGIVHNLHKASGGPWGGNQINKVFLELLVELFGESTFRDFCEENMDDFFNIYQKIEINKRLISTVKDETVKIDIPATLVEKIAEMYQLSGLESLKKAIKDANLQNMIEAKKGNKLFIKNGYFLDFFQTVCGKTVHLVKSIIQNDQQCNNIKYIILVGGFSESEVVQKNFRENFPDHEIKIPFEGGLAVLKGGTIYGFDSSIIQTRICPYTYGIKLERKFNPNIDDLSKTFIKGDKLYTEDCFDKFFEIDEPLTVGTKRSIEVHLNHDDDSLSCDLTDYKEIEVFSSLEKSPLYTTDLTCRLHGVIRVYPPHGRWPIMVRGQVEIEVTGADNFRITYIDNTGFTTSGTIDFLSS